VILLSAFNGMEKLIDQIYSEFDASITITPTKGKTFSEAEVNWKELASIKGVKTIAKGREELIVLEYGQPIEEQKDYRIKRTNAKLYAVDDAFLDLTALPNHHKGGLPVLHDPQGPMGIMGIGLINKLEASINSEFTIFLPKKNISVRAKQPFLKKKTRISSVLVYQNKIVNEETFLWPLSDFRKFVKDTNETISHIYVRAVPGADLVDLKNSFQQKLGDSFQVKTYQEKNALIFKTSKSEKLILTLILIFVFILACFNLVSSITMIYIEKKNNFLALKSLGMTQKGISQIFFFQGIMISALGALLGALLGYLICALQMKFEPIKISANQPYPIGFSWIDFSTIVFSVTILTVLFTFITVKLLTRND
jgi:lipoprotein-releasing system permease protein